jgi:ribonuclease HII
MSKLASFFQANQIEAGCDEAGRGCLAGPVCASAVILPPDFYHEDLNDSKKLSDKKRDKLRIEIERESISWSVVFIDHEKIDEINILNASILGMQEAVNNLKVKPDFLLIDGNRFHKHEIPHACFVKGDGRFMSIAAASILAKTHRDEYMEKLHEEFPAYNWKQNKGYPTMDHRIAFEKLGATPFHRKTFQLKTSIQISLDL